MAREAQMILECSYIEAIGEALRHDISSQPAAREDKSPSFTFPGEKPRPERARRETLQGSGEILREIVQETLQPLLMDETERSKAFVEAVNRYKKRLEAILEQESTLAYPRSAREHGQEARVHVRFSLRSDGSLESIDVPAAPGGFDRVLSAGLKKAAKNFPPFPGDIGCARLTFCWPVSFNLY
jgi:TonB family protein